MNYLRFLFSKVFLRQLGFAFIAGCLLLVGVYYGLDKITENNKHIEVPDFETLSIQEIPEIVERFELRYEVLDSAKFNPNYPPYAVIEQSPKAGSAVKRGRKIYFTLNPSGYRKLKVPNVIQITKRNAETRLTAVGFSLGEISYRDNIGRDMVLEMRYNGEKIQPGMVLPKTSKIDLVLGNGKR
ncbi:MAG: PASTA domain-containing protein [Flavobacteriaceae bacterium]|jgi:beta-lactam-binding protein with PASTA domain|nr:PASTA domain-containing protein [Flavobacteriaceae bacterium]